MTMNGRELASVCKYSQLYTVVVSQISHGMHCLVYMSNNFHFNPFVRSTQIKPQ